MKTPVLKDVRGIAFAAWGTGVYATPEAGQSLDNLAATGANWVAIVVTAYQPRHTSTRITWTTPRTPGDDELRTVIARAHALGLRVCLKPHVDLYNDDKHWRGDIGKGFDEYQCRQWFSAYEWMIAHYAALATDTDVEMFCLGTELEGVSMREKEWRSVIAVVKEHYQGPLTYAANWSGEGEAICWWDAVDVIGIDAYFPLTQQDYPSVEELKCAWIERGWIEHLAALSQRWGKPILLTEIGYRSVAGANKAPWDWVCQGTVDLQGQANAYHAAIDVLRGQPWLAGTFWWAWDSRPDCGGATDTGYTPAGKPAEAILRQYFKG